MRSAWDARPTPVTAETAAAALTLSVGFGSSSATALAWNAFTPETASLGGDLGTDLGTGLGGGGVSGGWIAPANSGAVAMPGTIGGDRPARPTAVQKPPPGLGW